MSTRELIDAIEAGEASNIEASFNDIMATKVSEKIDAMRDDMAQNVFKDPEMESEQEEELEEVLEEDGGVDESMDQPMSKTLAKGYTSSQEHGDKAPKMSDKQKAAAKVARDARDAADMKKHFAKSDAEMKKQSS